MGDCFSRDARRWRRRAARGDRSGHHGRRRRTTPPLSGLPPRQTAGPGCESRLWSIYGGEEPTRAPRRQALGGVLARLLSLQPEVAGHLRCLAWGPGGPRTCWSISRGSASSRIRPCGARQGRVFCIEDGPKAGRRETLARADAELSGAGRERWSFGTCYAGSREGDPPATRRMSRPRTWRRYAALPRGAASSNSSLRKSIRRPKPPKRCSCREPGFAREHRRMLLAPRSDPAVPLGCGS